MAKDLLAANLDEAVALVVKELDDAPKLLAALNAAAAAAAAATTGCAHDVTHCLATRLALGIGLECVAPHRWGEPVRAVRAQHAEAGDGLEVAVLAARRVIEEEHILVGDAGALVQAGKVTRLLASVDLGL